MTSKAILSICLVITAAVAALAQSPEIHTWAVRGNVYMLVGSGSNIVVSIGPDGALLVDSGVPENTDKILAAIQDLGEQFQRDVALMSVQPPFRGGAQSRPVLPLNTAGPPKPVQFILNTNADPDHTGGNAKISLSGGRFTGGNVAQAISDAAAAAEIIAHDNVLKRMSQAPFPAQPTYAYTTPYFKLSAFFNGEGVQLIHMPAAHTDGDSIVWFRGADVIAVGDLFSTVTYPLIDVERGGSIQGYIDSLNKILDIAIPEFRTQGGTMIVPGHGRLSDSAEVGYYRDMVTIIRDRIQDMIKKGMTLAQIKAARPTLDYDARYGKPDSFIEAVYRSLTSQR